MASPRAIGEQSFSEFAGRLRETSILCLPLGATEQHGPHLPFETDTIIAEGFTRLLVARFGEEFDLWQLPEIAVSLSREHEWAAGTRSLSVAAFAALMHETGRKIARELPARNLLIVNGHGGNRGILEPLMLDLRLDCGLNCCAVHPITLSRLDIDAVVPDVHAAKSEISVMLALAPDSVRREKIALLKKTPDADTIRRTVLDPGVTWPWLSDDPRIADQGVIGDPANASAEFGRHLLDRAAGNARDVLRRLRDNQAATRR